MAYDRHMGNLIQLFAVNSKSPAQQKPPDSSDLFRALRQNIYLPLPLFCQGFFLGGFLEQVFSLKEVKVLILLQVKNYTTLGVQATCIELRGCIVYAVLHSLYCVSVLNVCLSRDLCQVISSCFHLPCPSQPHIVQKRTKSPSHTN